MNKVCFVVFVLPCVLAAACSSTANTTNEGSSGAPPSPTSPPTSSADAGPPSTDDSGSPPSGSIATCGSQSPSGTLVTPKLQPADAPPNAVGGTIAAGTYQLTAVRLYGNAATGANGALYGSVQAKETLDVDGSEWRIAYHYEGPGTAINGVHAGTYLAVGTTLGGAEKCDEGDASNGIGGFLRPFTAGKTAGIDSIDIFEDDAKEIVFTYTKL